MASATARPTFSFHFHSSNSKAKTNVPFISLLNPRKIPLPAFHKHPLQRHFVSMSVDVSKEDKPVSEKPESSPAVAPEQDEKSSSEPKLDPRRLEEQFAVLNTGIYECRSCGYRYDEAAGDPSYPIPPGLEFGKLPEDWRCPTCGAAQSFFQSKSVEIAGFAQNQQFGLGGNTLTSGQKAVLIYGSLFLFFVLFLSGYFLQ